MTPIDDLQDFVVEWVAPHTAEAVASLRSALRRWDRKACLDTDCEIAFVVREPKRNLTIVQRDALGRQSLYRRYVEREPRFARSIATLFAQGERPQVSQSGLARFLTLQFSPAPSTLIDGVSKLLPGEQRVEDRTGLVQRRVDSALRFACDGEGSKNTSDVAATVFGDLARDFGGRPVISLLSGGIDSTTNLVGLTQSGVRPLLRTASFANSEFDEAQSACNTAACLGLKPRIRDITPQPIGSLASIAQSLTEPICDRALIPTHLLLEDDQGSEIVTGEGGDELWGSPRRWERQSCGTDGVSAAEYLELIACSRFDQRVAWFGSETLIRSSDRSLLDLFHDVANRSGARNAYEQAKAFQLFGWFAENVQAKDLAVARALGGNLHLPLVSRAFRKFIGGLSASAHYAGTHGKGLLRDYVATEIDRGVVDRPKQKFKVPPSIWLSQDVLDFVRGLVSGPTGCLSHIIDGGALFRSITSDEIDLRLVWGLFVVGVWLDCLQQEVDQRADT